MTFTMTDDHFAMTGIGDAISDLTFTYVMVLPTSVEVMDQLVVEKPAWMTEDASQWDEEVVPMRTKARVSYLRLTSHWTSSDETIPYGGWQDNNE